MGNKFQSDVSPEAPEINALASGGQQMPQQQPQQAPAPDHQQTVAALRHFEAIGIQLEKVLQDPSLGKSDLKSKIIDGVTALVSKQIMSPGQAVAQLSTFPERPFDQKKWLMNQMQQILQARNSVLSHHGSAFAGAGPEPTPSGETHMQDMSDMMATHYGGQNAG